MRIAALLLVVLLLAPSSLKAASATSEPLAHLILSFTCELPAKTAVKAEVWGRRVDGAGSFSASLNGSIAAVTKHEFQFDIPAGAYHAAAAVAEKQATCGSNYYVVVLPGLQRRERIDLILAIGDPITPMLIAGFKPKGVDVALFRNTGPPIACGSIIDSQKLQTIRTSVENDASAYYASSTDYDSEATSAAHLLRIRWPSGVGRYILIMLRAPSDIISGDPTYERLDLAPEILNRLLLSRPDGVSCI